MVYCVHWYKNLTNVHRGQRSQELTFDFTATTAGIYRTVSVTPGHRYPISAWGKHIRSASPVELALGLDLSGGQDHQAASIQWFPWDEVGELNRLTTWSPYQLALPFSQTECRR